MTEPKSKGKAPIPFSDTEITELKRLHGLGLGRNAIARQMKRSLRGISVHAERLNLSFDRTATAAATEAKKMDAKARRAAIIEGLYDVAEDELAYLKQEDDYDLVEVSLGKPVKYKVGRLPAQDRKALVSSISTATSAAARLEALDGDPSLDAGLSMLGALADGVRKIVNSGTNEVSSVE